MTKEYCIEFEDADPKHVLAADETEARTIAAKIWERPILAVKLFVREDQIDLVNPPENAMLTPEECMAWLRIKSRRALIRNKRIPKHRLGERTVLYHVGTVLAAIGPKRKGKTN